MPERIRIVEEGRPAAPPAPPVPSRVDLQDILIVTGILSGEAAAIVIWWPAALILLCLFSFGFAYLIQLAAAKDQRGNPRK